MEAVHGTVGGMRMRRQSQFLRPCSAPGVSFSPRNNISQTSPRVTSFSRTSCCSMYANSTFWDPKHAPLRTWKSLQGKKSVVPNLKICASQYENVLPLPRDDEIASLEHLLEASPEQSALPATPTEQRNQRLEALIERVIFDCRFFTLMAVVGSLAGSLLCFFKGSFFVVELFMEYFQASWQGLGTSQVVFLLVEAVGRCILDGDSHAHIWHGPL